MENQINFTKKEVAGLFFLFRSFERLKGNSYKTGLMGEDQKKMLERLGAKVTLSPCRRFSYVDISDFVEITHLGRMKK
jgi:hypothetical protein